MHRGVRPLVGAILAGLLGWKLGRAFAHSVTILLVAVSFAASAMAFLQVAEGAHLDSSLYTWLSGDGWTLRSASSSTASPSR